MRNGICGFCVRLCKLTKEKRGGEAVENVFGIWTNERKKKVLFRRKLCNGVGKEFYCADCLKSIAKEL